MRRSWLVLLLCLVVCLACAVRFVAADDNTVRINEAATQILFGGAQTNVTLALANDTGQAIDVQLRLELLDPHDAVRVRATRAAQLKSGANHVTVAFMPALLATLNDSERKLIMWYRLRYSITADAGPAAPPVLAAGVISLNQLDTPDLFELHVAAPQFTREGQTIRARARATHPLTGRAAPGVKVAGAFTFDSPDGDDVVLKAAGTTDADGYAALDFALPATIADDEGELNITARRGDFEQAAEQDIQFDHHAQILISTDKPLYQPGQTLHMRTLIFTPTKHALAAAEALLTISDPENTTVFRAPLKTSRFGVASIDWPVPENTRLGDYRLNVKLEEGRYEDTENEATIRISRYDLPNFAVSVKPDRPYYLPGQVTAAVAVRADYLFGEPVTRGHVRVVRETERKWNYREQKWDIDEDDKYEGETDAAGRFVAHVNLQAAHEDFAAANYSRFRDLSYAAYFTDPTTNRTEQRRFDLRLTHDAIHVYLIEGRARPAKGLPVEFYVSTSYADGLPAECAVTISGPLLEAEPQSMPILAPHAPTLMVVRTNKYGVAKVAGLRPPWPEAEGADNITLQVSARDDKGQTGRQRAEFYSTVAPVIRVATHKTLYRPGEPIQVEITANRPELKLVIDVARDFNLLRSEFVQLHNGRATLTLPATPEFHDEITVAAYTFARMGADGDDYAAGSRTVLFPRNHDLQLDLRLSKDTYQPGATAHADLRVRDGAGHAAESALGIVVFDKAVAERARTDGEFGTNGFYNLYRYWHGTDALAGFTRGDLNRLDLAQPWPAGLDLVAEIMLRNEGLTPQLVGGLDLAADESSVFNQLIGAQLAALRQILQGQYATQMLYPADEMAIRRLLFTAGVNFDALRDPWGTSFRLRCSVARENDVLAVVSAGADKRFDTPDDFVATTFTRPYFRFTGEELDRAVARYHARTGAYVRDAATLKRELAREGIDLDMLRDPWGQAYQLHFDVAGTKYLVVVASSGPDGKFEPADDPRADDFRLWTAQIDYSPDLRAQLDDALTRHFAATARFPQARAEFDAAMARAGLTANALHDPWGQPYYVTFRQSARYADRAVVLTYAQYGQQPKERTEITPVTQTVNYIDLRSAGPDGKEGTADDFEVTTIFRISTEQMAQNKMPKLAATAVQLTNGSGALSGTITDPNGAVIPGAHVEATNKYSGQVFNATGSDDGTYLVRELPAGLYSVAVLAPGFKNMIITEVPVGLSNLTQLNVMLAVGSVSEMVEVSGGSAELMQTMTSQSSVTRQIVDLPISGRKLQDFALLSPGITVVTKSGATATPRLREYFPETLVWQPALETDRQGRAQLDFKLADNITTWQLSVFGSTADGEIGAVEREVRAFQPFFVEHDPPRILTVGDEIMLPVVLRNYLAHAQQVAVQMQPAAWFTLLTPAEQRAQVPAGDATRTLFGFRTIAAVHDGKQRVTAIGADASDAIERPVNVHPDGQEVAQTSAQLLGAEGMLAADLPANAIPRSAHAELKLYPNLMTHVIESVEALLVRPHGCAEQTISATYPSLLVLRYYKHAQGNDARRPPIAAKAEKYLRAGYDRLLSYRAPDGGFSYWGRGDADIALTAYAVRFLEDARALLPIDEAALQAARTWLVKQQQQDGSWPAYDWDKKGSGPRTLLLTAYVARVLARHEAAGPNNDKDKAPAQATAAAQTTSPVPTATPPTATGTDPARISQPPALQRALDFLAPHIDEIDEPYFIAAYTIAAVDANAPPATINKATTRLRALAKEEAGGAYWALETNTPFYGWGLAGRIETTALVVQALDKAHADPALTARGVSFLLRNKDRYGVWLSTQATVNVLDALVALSPARGAGSANANAAGPASRVANEPAEVFVNNQRAGTLLLPTDARLDAPLTLDLTRFLAPGPNRIEIKRASTSKAFAQVVTTYYVPWAQATTEATHHAAPSAANTLRLAVNFDKVKAPTGAAVACHVAAERIGFHGYGMLLAEIGLPPGADVDRASLERAMQESGWALSSYDVLPDRLVVYLWPHAGGTQFTFTFRPRYGLSAQTAPSVLYDYYNPEARTVLAPTKFNVDARARAE